jgi:hypothetical protein
MVTDSGIGRWQEVEYDAAFDKHVDSPDFPVVLMLLKGQPAPRLLARRAGPAPGRDLNRRLRETLSERPRSRRPT